MKYRLNLNRDNDYMLRYRNETIPPPRVMDFPNYPRDAGVNVSLVASCVEALQVWWRSSEQQNVCLFSNISSVGISQRKNQLE
jgi:hypothetical protein